MMSRDSDDDRNCFSSSRVIISDRCERIIVRYLRHCHTILVSRMD